MGKLSVYIYIAENPLIFPWHVFVKFPDFSLILPIFQIPWFFPAGIFFHKIPCFPWFFPAWAPWYMLQVTLLEMELATLFILMLKRVTEKMLPWGTPNFWSCLRLVMLVLVMLVLVWVGLVWFGWGLTPQQQARVISRRWNDDDEISFLVEETGVPGGPGPGPGHVGWKGQCLSEPESVGLKESGDEDG